VQDSTKTKDTSLVHYPQGFWARLTSEKAAQGGYYSWKRLQSDASTDYAPATTGTDNAKEVNEAEDISAHATTGAVVWLEYDAVNHERVFSYGAPAYTLPLATYRYQVLAANDADLIFKADWVSAH